jgi:hypothetical protein
MKHMLSDQRCPKSNTSHRDELLAWMFLAGLFVTAIALQLPMARHNPLGIPLLVCESMLATLFSVAGSLVWGIYMAKRRGWL